MSVLLDAMDSITVECLSPGRGRMGGRVYSLISAT